MGVFLKNLFKKKRCSIVCKVVLLKVCSVPGLKFEVLRCEVNLVSGLQNCKTILNVRHRRALKVSIIIFLGNWWLAFTYVSCRT